MSAQSSRTAWTTALLATAVGAGLLTAAPATALTGSDSADGSYAFTAKLNIGDRTACSGALVDAQWVITAATCFSDGGKPVPAGKPTVKTTVTVGRADLTQATGNVQEAVELVPRPDRDVVMVKLAQRVPESAAKPVKVATKAPVEGEQLQVAGFGRTKTEWVPNKLHASAFTVASTDPASIGLNGSENAVICQGDAGAPALRGTGDSAELVALNIRSWQGGCLGTDENEKRTSALDARLDNLAPWVSTVAFRDAAAAPAVTVAGDDNGDGVADLYTIAGDKTLSVRSGARNGLFGAARQLTGGWGFTQTTAGDFTGDRLADLVATNASGDLFLWTGNSSGIYSASKKLTDGWNFTQTIAGDFTGDGKVDLMARTAGGDLRMWSGNGNGTFGAPRQITGGWDFTQTIAGDFTGDGKVDLMARTAGGDLRMWAGNGNGTFGSARTVTGGWNFTQTVAGDFTGDGKVDLMARTTGGELRMWAGNGNGTFGSATAPGQ
ncbi:FG-GAP-like repeat-containing protein [Streptomyces sp. BPTC-684]|uniref:FG-GAP-like repeat-containing protein n=1 Tax=Streptomyces sp. BPTC-684 TaxID=3043734 RepID=UPI0024B0CEA3|nr:FG-GAP-like repeat-containing protein [Streptomyces sp. BPTC-684]WHM36623.1 FG-GAP-like repeat-containing protein [Streptomyces sp. BPTC-684]